MSTAEASSLVALAQSVEDGESGGTEHAVRIRNAHELTRLADRRLHELVAEAHRSGTSWQAIGEALGVSRQAAFKRFGADEAPDHPAAAGDLVDRTTTVFEHLSAGDYPAVRALMSYACSRVLTKRRLMSTWQQVIDATGPLQACVDPLVQTPDGRTTLERFANRQLAQGAIIQLTLQHDHGEWIGRVAYNGSGKVTGILIAPVGTTNLPF